MDGVALAAGVLIAGTLFVLSVRNWRFGLYALLIYLPFAGFVSLRTGQSAVGLLAKDFLFVVPTYISFFIFHRFPLTKTRIPTIIVIAMIMFAAIVLIQVFNPNVTAALVSLIGLKVWLMYVPLTFVAAAAIREKSDLIFFLRLCCVIATVPIAVGFLQRVGVDLIGREVLVERLYGGAVNVDNLGLFVGVNDFEGLYRIIGTFSAAGQYGIYLLIVIVLSLLLSMIEKNFRWKLFATALTWVAVVAAFISGSKGVIVFVPLVLGAAFLLSRNMPMLVACCVLLPVLYVVALTVSEVDVTALLAFLWDYSFYNVQDFGSNQMLDTFYNYPLGLGTGMTTSGARYAFADDYQAYQSIYMFEVYYAKTIVELSLVGIIPVLILMFAPLIQAAKLAWHTQTKDIRCIAAGFCSFFLMIVVLSYKAWPLDVDPANVLFWVFSGVFYKVSYLASRSTGESAEWSGKHIGFARRPAVSVAAA